MKQEFTATVQVNGKGESKSQAFSAALGQVQAEVMKNSPHLLLRIEPQDVRVVKAEERCVRERFLFLFFPRERRHYSVSLEIVVKVTAFDMAQVAFTPQ